MSPAAERVPERVKPHLRRAYRAWLANPIRSRAAKAKLERELDGRAPGLLRRVDPAISSSDGMWRVGTERYFRVGLDAVRCIDEAYTATGKEVPATILDMPSGGGRVLRFLAVRFPRAKLTACDITEAQVRFCAQRFGATPVVSSPDFDQVELPGPFDLIWSGSLVTHLDDESTNAYLRLCRRNLSPDGIFVLTTHGEEVARRMVDDPAFYQLDRGQADELLAQYEGGGFGFVDYSAPHEPHVAGYSRETAPYGVSLMSPDWVRTAAEHAGLASPHFAAHGWNGHHDVFGLTA